MYEILFEKIKPEKLNDCNYKDSVKLLIENALNDNCDYSWKIDDIIGVNNNNYLISVNLILESAYDSEK